MRKNGPLSALLLLVAQALASAQEQRPLTLADALRDAIANNTSFVVVQQDVEIASAQVRQARGVFQPRLVADLHYSYDHNPGTFFFTEAVDHQAVVNLAIEGRVPTGLDYRLQWNTFYEDNNSVAAVYRPLQKTLIGLSLTQPLLRNAWFTANRGPIEVASLRHDASRFTRQAQLERIVGDVELAYWDLFLAGQERQVRQAALDLALKQVEESRKQLKLGVVAQVDVLEADATVARSRDDIEASNQDIAEAEGRLLALLQPSALPLHADLLLVDSPTVDPDSVPIEERLRIARERRPDLSALRKNQQAEEVLEAIAQNRLLPQLDLYGSVGVTGFAGTISDGYGTSGFNEATMNFLTGKTLAPYRPDPALEGNFGTMFKNLRYLSGTVGARLDVPLGNDQARAQYDAQHAVARKAHATLEGQERLVSYQVLSAVKRLKADLERIRVAQQTVKLAESLLDAQQKRYHNGVAISFDVLRASSEVTRARIAALRAQVSGRISEARLAVAQGTYLDEHHIVVR